MKKYGFYLIVMLVALFAATGSSCSDDNDDHLNEWMVANQLALNAIKANPEYKELRSPGNEGSVYYKVLTKGDGTDPIYYTSTVTCYYKGWFVADYPKYSIENGTVFDQKLFDDGTPYSFLVGATGSSAVINGWKTALQNMVKGDKWEVWIPYQLGYGREGSSNGSIPGYSVLVFEIEVMTVSE
ncbi:MAG: FKBP-type peptidyl-prolyl cis-trans isomerase [Tannerella sp.]|jgi:peptidylprolyl isomerase/FKBP-type peptidyl-prolyl cis-trans isomerase FklB|nr:FKBP-type peptidyl-prolyl cis-trans isomerase [Tannerella sp.]